MTRWSPSMVRGMASSRATRTGSRPAPTVDQRNLKRDSRPDMRAFERR